MSVARVENACVLEIKHTIFHSKGQTKTRKLGMGNEWNVIVKAIPSQEFFNCSDTGKG
jgi:hypothetical protein